MFKKKSAMRILISGASGLVGKALLSFLKTCGHEVVRLVRRPQEVQEDAIFWDPDKGELALPSLEGFDAVINLSGENIAGGRWNEKRKQRILESRIQSTATLAKALSQLKSPPQTFICASAVGIYGDQGDSWCSEDTTSGAGFLADVCKQWEAAAAPAVDKGIRTIFLRFGIVLSAQGGALAKMMLPFKLGFGGALGSGQQYMSWIDIDDLVAIVLYALTHKSLKGPVNAVSPNPVTNTAFTKILGNALSRPIFLNMPAFALRLILGKEMADEFLLSSTRVKPLRLTQAGYSFLYPDLASALKHEIK